MSSPNIGRTRPAGPPTERIVAEVPQFTRVSQDALAEIASGLGVAPGIVLRETLVMELTARQPYDATYGNIDVYQPGRWDTTENLIFMDTIVQTGPDPGEWDGSASYITFKPASDGSYLCVGNFSGSAITAQLDGPWGQTTAYTATASDSGVVTAMYSTGQLFEFNLNFTAAGNNYGIGYIESIQVFAVTNIVRI
jgi:hypothetical protein